MENHIEIPHYSLSPRVLTLYSTLEGYHFSERQLNTFKNLEENSNQYNELSQHSVKRLRKSINFLIYISKTKEIQGLEILSKSQAFTTEYEKLDKFKIPVTYKLAMITLTLPAAQIHTDEEIKAKCLNQFLIEIRKASGLKDYIWKAERQENNNIHFHILINQYIHYAKIRDTWNRIVKKLGYIDNYKLNQEEFFKNGFRLSENPKDKRSEKTQRKAYEKGKSEGWINPNSTDIHSLYKVRNAGAYITKYIAKGVTKTQRTEAIKKLRKQAYEITKNIEEKNKEICFYSSSDQKAQSIQAEIDKLENSLSCNLSSLSELLKSGISGRIWGQSQSLSMLKPFTKCESWENVPEIDEVVKNAEFTIENSVGTRKIHSYIFDIEKFPLLKANLDFHIENLKQTYKPGQT